jgi:hypothetical protein
MAARELYGSSNGDRWQLARDPDSGRVFILHEPNPASGGRTSEIDIGGFLVTRHGPEHQELLRLIGTLVEESAEGLVQAGVIRGPLGSYDCFRFHERFSSAPFESRRRY